MTSIIRFPWPMEAKSQIHSYIKAGKTIAFPTETFYGLGGNALSQTLVERIFQIKQRPQSKPLLLLIQPTLLLQLCPPPPAKVERLMKHFWPGPLTLILPAHPNLPNFVLGPSNTIAVRHSSSPIVEQLIAIGQCPLIGTSANLSETPENTHPSGVLSHFGKELDLLIDGGATLGGNASTILDTTSSPFGIVRQGAIPLKHLQSFL